MLHVEKPSHLAAEFAAQFQDPSVVEAYWTRPPYPRGVFAQLDELAAGGRVLELGCGSGDITYELAPRVRSVDAVDPSAPMLAVAKRRIQAANVRWFLDSAESFAPDGPYDLVVAAESLHWMHWREVLPKIGRCLAPDGIFAIVVDRAFSKLPWSAQLRLVVARHSTNRTYVPYDIVEELTTRALFQELGRATVVEHGFSQGIDDYVESFHSRNGFSRDRMRPAAAAAFDAEVRALVLAHRLTGVVSGEVSSTIVWGRPAAH
jgi:SAM-dependent methyltransferase